MVQVVNKLVKKLAKQYKNTLVGIAVLTLAGCVSGTGGYRPPVEDRTGSGEVVQSVEPASTGVVVKPTIIRESRTEQPVAVPVPTAATSRAQNPAVIALLDTANKQKVSGSMNAAQSSLERAQRIAPRDPEIYFQLADIQRLEGRWNQAEQLALKGTNMAIGDAIMLRRLWLLIADIRESYGNYSSATKARQQAMQY
ncbi:tetratricopeptide repeat protein [Neptuniibacter sp.]|uniref:tetratricopeptide repeat protein n=1 Tax=Neptuniibacter sp. TaxID=1962643 RepID=UPI002625D9A5|nr:tetratricopeptide repeat protein [Neptuniibacter sp.]MCP4597704.1 tetratricopeptide repeat protein [Neptuniibacter sp.]